MANSYNHRWKRKNLYQGIGIRVAIEGDIGKNGEQKNRPGIILKTYPSHIKVQLLSTVPNNRYDYFSIKINNKIQYVRPIYFRTIQFENIVKIWRDDNDKAIKLDKTSTFFIKVIEMEYKELFSHELNLKSNQIENEKIVEHEEEQELEI